MPRTSGTRPKGSGIPAKGKGWGGAAKGAGKTAGLDDVRPARWDPANLADKERAAAQMRGVLYNTALDGENEHARIAAADKLLDRLEGKPVQKQELSLRTVNPDDLTDDDLAAIAAGRGGAPSGASEAED